MGSILTEEAQNGARLGVVIGDCLNHSETSEYHCSNLWNMSGTSEFGLVQGFAADAAEQCASLCCGVNSQGRRKWEKL